MQAAGGNKRKVRVVRLALPRLDRPLEVIESPMDTTPDRWGEFRQTTRAMREQAWRLVASRQAGLEPLALSTCGRERAVYGWAAASED